MNHAWVHIQFVLLSAVFMPDDNIPIKRLQIQGFRTNKFTYASKNFNNELVALAAFCMRSNRYLYLLLECNDRNHLIDRKLFIFLYKSFACLFRIETRSKIKLLDCWLQETLEIFVRVLIWKILSLLLPEEEIREVSNRIWKETDPEEIGRLGRSVRETNRRSHEVVTSMPRTKSEVRDHLAAGVEKESQEESLTEPSVKVYLPRFSWLRK